MKYSQEEKNKLIQCHHCGAEFVPTIRVFYHLKAGQTQYAYCSGVCSRAAASMKLKGTGVGANAGKQLRKIIQYGPCPTCGKPFESKVSGKQFCSLNCYVKSSKFKEMIKKNQEKVVRRGFTPEDIEKSRARRAEKMALTADARKRICPYCGVEYFVPKKHTNKKYCSPTHRRLYMAERFDRWIASPKTISLPQNFDEFLTQDELACLVEGCTWRGHNLSVHMNVGHGVMARDFKRAAGFNLNSGIISLPLREVFSARQLVGVGLTPPEHTLPPSNNNPTGYRSLEGIEHHTKARALSLQVAPPKKRTCMSCGAKFDQLSPFGRKEFCTFECRDGFYQRQNALKKLPMQCCCCGGDFVGNYSQILRRRRDENSIVVCSAHCRQVLNSQKRSKTCMAKLE